MNKQIYSDKELFKLVAQDNTEAFEILFKQYYGTLIRVLMRYSRDPEKIKDWIQEIYVKLWENRKTINMEDVENVKGYLIVLARNHIIKQLSKKKEVKLVYDEQKAGIDIADNNLEENLKQSELQQAYVEALNKMPPRTREAYFLNRERGMTYSKVAEELGTSIKTVEAQVSRAIAILRRELVSFLN
jgi:RNA polymerase sigma-70 factor (ECF subfamily)